MTSAEMIASKNIRPSLQRIMIYDYLKTHRTHPTVDEIYNALAPSVPTLSKTTVYNTVKLFADSGLVKMLTIEEQQSRFDACTDLHGHFLCDKCKKVYDFDVDEPKCYKLNGFKICTKEVFYTGVCSNCNTDK